MPPAQRRIKRALRKSKEKPRSAFSVIVLIVVLAAIVFLLLKISTKYWNGSDKVSFVFRKPNGDVAVEVLDPKLNELTSLIIPGDTQIEVARNYGTLRIKNVWQLSKNEKLKGDLLSQSVSQNFLFPVYLWSDSDGESIQPGNFFKKLKFSLLPNSTNIPFGDRISMLLFSMRLKSGDFTEIDLGRSQFIHREKLSDGQTGYTLQGKLSEHFSVYFSDNSISENGIHISIIDGTKKFGIGETVGGILETLGGKVISINKDDSLADADCKISGKDKKIVKKISAIFNCSIISNAGDSELQIILGAKFAKRF